MQLTLLVGFFLVAAVSANVEPRINYHEEIGIPTATRIKAAEDAIHERIARGERIVGGVVAPINAHPYLAGLVISFVNAAGTSACGATLISPTRLTTAAHCWVDQFQASQFIVVLGSQFLFSGGTRITTSNVVVHPEWTPSILRNDVAIIYLPTSVVYSQSIQPVVLPLTSLWDDFEGRWAVAAGYGKTDDSQVGVSSSSVVSHVNLQVMPLWQCQAVFGSTFVQPSNICTNGFGGVGICGGDSGGPLVVIQNGQHVMIGISSFVARVGCQLGHPSAFARVTSFFSFILQHM